MTETSATAGARGAPAPRRRWLLRLGAAVFTLVLILALVAAGELLVRRLDGFALVETKLVRSDPEAARWSRFDLVAFARMRARDAAAHPEWIVGGPERPAPPPSPEIKTRTRRFLGRRWYLYHWNEHYVARHGHYWTVPDIPPEDDWIWRFSAPWGEDQPSYRYPPDTLLPTLLPTNGFGWRGPEIELNKPDGTIRIACVGASTTVSAHELAHSYPELLQHWLNLWSEARGWEVRFEVINAGREGINSRGIAGVVRHEVVPMDLDYLVYYEGSNEFNIPTVVRFPKDTRFGNPPEGAVPSLNTGFLSKAARHSALALRARDRMRAPDTGQEPQKPENRFELLNGLDEHDPDLTNLGAALNLASILENLDRIKADCDDHNIHFVMTTFKWMACDGMVLDPVRDLTLFLSINRTYWPMRYESIARSAAFQNRVFAKWAAASGASLIDIADGMPDDPALFRDPVHNTDAGVRARGWVVLEGLIELIEADILAGRRPVPDRDPIERHPGILPAERYYRPAE